MDNYLDTGGVLPSGLLSGNDNAERMAGFNKTYRNYPLRAGIINQIYSITDPNNFTKLTTEYDVLVFEQNEDRGNTIVTYKNCISSDPLGSIADFLDKNLRVKTDNDSPDDNLNTVGQDGAIVLLLCLDAVSEKAIIIGGLPHPDRDSTLIDTDPYLEGEYNGINIKVDTDGSATLTFKGATDNDGNPTDDSQGDTTIEIQTDGSFQVEHSEITLLLDKTNKEINMSCTGNWTVNIQGDTNISTQGNTEIDTQGNTTISTQGDVSVSTQGTTSVDSQGDITVNTQGNANVTASNNVVVMGSNIQLNGQAGMVLTTMTDPVVDLITGVPTMGVPNVTAGQ